MLLRALASIALLFSTAVLAESAVVTVRDGWVRPAPPVAQVRAGYLVLVNPGEKEIVIDRVDSKDFGAVEIHEMVDDGGVMRMRRVDKLRVPAKGEVALRPGGLHLMLFRPVRELAAGEKVGLRLRGVGFELETSLVVKPMQ
jgi:hypothetical protein